MRFLRRNLGERTGVTPGGVLVYGRERGYEAGDEAMHAFGNLFLPDLLGDADVGLGIDGDVGDNNAVTADTVYDLASLTKPMVTCALAIQSGVDWDAPIAPLLPELRVRSDGHGAAVERITWAQVLGHAGGFAAHEPLYRRLLNIDAHGPDAPHAPHDRRERLLQMAAAVPLAYEPGSEARYSDLGYILLGFALERLLGARLDVLARARIFAPLGMADTGYVALGSPSPLPTTSAQGLGASASASDASA